MGAGRRKRSPASAKYSAEKRWKTNKRKKAVKYAKKHDCVVKIREEVGGPLVEIVPEGYKPKPKPELKPQAEKMVQFPGPSLEKKTADLVPEPVSSAAPDPNPTSSVAPILEPPTSISETVSEQPKPEEPKQ